MIKIVIIALACISVLGFTIASWHSMMDQDEAARDELRISQLIMIGTCIIVANTQPNLIPLSRAIIIVQLVALIIEHLKEFD